MLAATTPHATDVARSQWKGRPPNNEVLKVNDLGEGKEYLHNIQCLLYNRQATPQCIADSIISQGNYGLPLKKQNTAAGCCLLDFVLLSTGDCRRPLRLACPLKAVFTQTGGERRLWAMWGRGQPQTIHKNSVPDFSLQGIARASWCSSALSGWWLSLKRLYSFSSVS